MNFSIAQLQAFVHTAEKGSFKAAAVELNKRSQVIAQLVSTMEDSCDLLLFERHVRRLVITSQGQKLYRYAKRVLQTAETLSKQISSYDQDIPEQFSLALDNTLLCPELTACYMAVLEEFPTIDLKVQTGGTAQVIEWVQSGEVEMGLIFSIFSEIESVIQVPAYNFPMVDIAAAETIKKGAVVSEDEIAEMVQIVPNVVFDYAHDSHYVLSAQYIRTNNMREALEMLRFSKAWVNIPEYIAQPYLKSGVVNDFSIQGANQNVWWAEIIYQSEEAITLAGDLFAKQVQNLEKKLA
ncbi:LysR family transcriptional regulator [Agarivorans aestuarii]|uniref:LysR family transcriptional regulator n=1 Tax=Agarivorans aestuarii TaxID=1563703 RepID=A0ABU7G7C8_9ALTE|nr:LysR family transcriptional regulator [Agarivorans aestuarii]MEE1674929.1 LysR family transcriptional regulator [Agarivorans aestuarii]